MPPKKLSNVERIRKNAHQRKYSDPYNYLNDRNNSDNSRQNSSGELFTHKRPESYLYESLRSSSLDTGKDKFNIHASDVNLAGQQSNTNLKLVQEIYFPLNVTSDEPMEIDDNTQSFSGNQDVKYTLETQNGLKQQMEEKQGNLMEIGTNLDNIRKKLKDSDNTLYNMVSQHIEKHAMSQETALSNKDIMERLNIMKKVINAQKYKIDSIEINPISNALRSKIENMNDFPIEKQALDNMISRQDIMEPQVTQEKDDLALEAELLKEKINRAILKEIGTLRTEEKLIEISALLSEAEKNLSESEQVVINAEKDFKNNEIKVIMAVRSTGSRIKELTGNTGGSFDQIKGKLDDTMKRLDTLKTSMVSEDKNLSSIKIPTIEYYAALRKVIEEIPAHSFGRQSLLNASNRLDAARQKFDSDAKKLLTRIESMLAKVNESTNALQTGMQTYNLDRIIDFDSIIDTFSKLKF